MKSKIVGIFLLYISWLSCSIVWADDGTLWEDIVLCHEKAELNTLEKKVYGLEGYSKDSDFFFVPTTLTKAFGFEIAYVGLGGVDLFPGENITVKGKFKSVKKIVLPRFNRKFECDSSGCGSEIVNERQIAVYPHPTDKSMTIIQCLYLGN